MIFFDIDTQHDFMDKDGALAVPDADEIRANLERLLKTAGERRITTVSSRDSHIEDDPEFAQFPPHCVDGTPGAERIFKALPDLPRRVIPVDAGAIPDTGLESGAHYVVKKRAFDLFTNPWFKSVRENGAFKNEDCVVFGVATDYCVRAAALGLAKAGARVCVVEDAIRGVAPDTTEKSVLEMRDAGVEFTTTDEVLKLIG